MAEQSHGVGFGELHPQSTDPRTRWGLSRNLFRHLRCGHNNVVTQIRTADAILTSCAAKARIVEADEREAGQRALLNLGHTFGHAFEAVAGYDGSLLHGEAIAAGMGLAFDLATYMDLCSGQDSARAKAHLEASGLASGLAGIPVGNASTQTLIGLMGRDKKARNGTMHFVLPRRIGDSFVCDSVTVEALQHVLEAGE